MANSGVVLCPKCSSTNQSNNIWCWKCATQLNPAPPTMHQQSPGNRASTNLKTITIVVLGITLFFAFIIMLANINNNRIEEARKTALRSTKSRMPWLIEMPETSKSVVLGRKFKACITDKITFSDDDILLDARNPFPWPTCPDVYVDFYDINGKTLGTIHPIRHFIKDFEPGNTRTYEEPIPCLSSKAEFFAIREGNEADSSPPSQPTSSNDGVSDGYISASGNIWIGIAIYFKAGSNYTYVGKVTDIDNRYYDPILGKTFDGVEIEYPSGNREWKERRAIRAWGYVKKNDPAMQ